MKTSKLLLVLGLSVALLLGNSFVAQACLCLAQASQHEAGDEASECCPIEAPLAFTNEFTSPQGEHCCVSVFDRESSCECCEYHSIGLDPVKTSALISAAKEAAQALPQLLPQACCPLLAVASQPSQPVAAAPAIGNGQVLKMIHATILLL